MANFLWVALGGAIGSTLRYSVSVLLARFWVAPSFPYATLCVNVLGCFLIGLLASLGSQKQFLEGSIKIFLITGILGGFTTFSAFGLETFVLLKNNHMNLAALNIILQLGLGILAVYLGNRIGMIL